MNNISKLVLAISALVLCTFASADPTKNIQQSFSAEDLDVLSLEISIAEIEIETYDGNEIQLDIDIESDRGWFSWRAKDVDDIELEIEERGNRLFLSIDEDNIEQQWRLRIPAKLNLEMDLGVGDVRIDDFVSELNMEIGVGAVRVLIGDVDYDSIHVSAGVGDAKISGFSNRVDNERSFISADAYYHGEGDQRIEIDLGVGDVSVRKQ